MKNGLIISIGIALSGLLLGIFVRSAAGVFVDRDRQVDVRGLSEREVMANVVTWPIVYRVSGNDLQSLYAQYESTTKKVTDYLTANAIETSEFSCNAPDVEDNLSRYSSEVPLNRYTISGTVIVTSNNVEKVRDLINRQGELLKQGVQVVTSDWSNRITYEFTGLNDIKPEMIEDATHNARRAAEKFAHDSGAKVGRLLQAHQGQFSIEDRDDYTPYIKRVRVVTSLVYEIK